MKINKATELYIQYDRERGLAQNTLKLHRVLFKRFIRFCRLHHLDDVRNVTSQLLIDYALWVKDQKGLGGHPLHQNYCNDHIAVVRRLFQLLYERQFILSDVARKLPELHNVKSNPRGVMTPDQVATMLCQPNLTTPTGFRDRTIFELLYASALRAGELCHLSIYGLDLTGKTLRVVQGKGNKDRIVPISKVAVRYLREYLEKIRPILQAQRKKWPSALSADVVFLTAKGQPFTLGTLYYVVRKYRDNAGLPPDITTHSFRHTCAVELLKGGASIRHVQELLGHSEITTTQVYTRLVPTELKKIHDKTAPSERGRTPDVQFDPDKAKWITPKRRRKNKKNR